MKRSLGVLVAIFFCTTGCAAALIGGGLYKSSKTKEQRQNFMTEFQKTNTEREVKGLQPLDWCSEAYKFDEGWANNDKICAKRIKAYKKGDVAALNLGSSTNAIQLQVKTVGESAKPGNK